MRVLYAGDSPAGGPANYLLAVLRRLKARVVHVPPGKILRPALFRQRFDAFILSDFSRKDMPAAAQRAIGRQVKEGAGLLMVGGWGSFNGPFGKWKGSLVERLLPVACVSGDDRLNLPGGAWIVEKRKHAMFRGLDFKNPPVICGLNRVRTKKSGRVLLAAKRIRDRKEFPLFVIHRDSRKRTAALTTDLAPHWSGGLTDWGTRSVSLPVRGRIRVEVGADYLRFVSSLLKWLSYECRFSRRLS